MEIMSDLVELYLEKKIVPLRNIVKKALTELDVEELESSWRGCRHYELPSQLIKVQELVSDIESDLDEQRKNPYLTRIRNVQDYIVAIQNNLDQVSTITEFLERAHDEICE